MGELGGGEILFKIVYAMPSAVLAAEYAGSAGTTDGGGDEGMGEPDPVGGHGIHVRGLYVGIARASHGVPALVVSE